MNFSISEYKGKSLNGIFKVRNEVGDDLILIKAKSNKVGRSFLSSPFSRLILYSAIYVNEEEKGEIVHENHLEELFPYLSTIDEISGRPNYESGGYTESKYSLFFSNEDFLAKIVGYFFSYKNWYLRGEGFLVRKIGEDIEFRELRIEEYLPTSIISI